MFLGEKGSFIYGLLLFGEISLGPGKGFPLVGGFSSSGFIGVLKMLVFGKFGFEGLGVPGVFGYSNIGGFPNLGGLGIL